MTTIVATEGPVRYATYLRISIDRTGEELAVERQREDCERIAQEHGWKLVGEYVDNSIIASDRRKTRPGYNELMAAYGADMFDALVCWDLDRLTRQPRELEDWIDAATDKACCW
jgi:site-specific DNA recombinase